MGSLRSPLEDVKGQLQACGNKREMLELLVEFSKDLDPFPEEQKTEENIIKGCNSLVYLYATLQDGKLRFTGFSESHVVAGYVAVLIKAVNGLSPDGLDDSAEEDVKDFLKETKLDVTQLSSRANAFGNIFLKMREQADAMKQ